MIEERNEIDDDDDEIPDTTEENIECRPGAKCQKTFIESAGQDVKAWFCPLVCALLLVHAVQTCALSHKR